MYHILYSFPFKSFSRLGGGFLFLIKFLFFIPFLTAQNFQISGKVTSRTTGKVVNNAEVFVESTSRISEVNSKGNYVLKNLPKGTYVIRVFAENFESEVRQVMLQKNEIIDFQLQVLADSLEGVEVIGTNDNTFGIQRLQSVDGFGIYEAKKTEVIVLEGLTANLATNNARQVYSKVAGLNIWESDGAGIQLGIGGRGLSPHRTSNFNTRQNGYDISADALGYPESYYTPPTEALQEIQIIRGAASLQYGTQFGGMLNFILKKAPEKKAFELTSRQTIGSFNFFNSFNSIAGTKGKFNYYTFYQYKKGNGWRSNSEFDVHTAYARLGFEPNDRLKLNVEYTFMNYLAQQAGGLTDREFRENPRQSNRTRNWFRVNWNLFALDFDYRFSSKLRLNSRTFALLAGKDALGDLSRIDRPDPMKERDLLSDEFQNFGNETRLIYNYEIGKQMAVFLVGARYYRGLTDRKQGKGDDTNSSTFKYLENANLQYSDYDFPNQNVAVFAENIFDISPRFSLTPGIRFEHIETKSEGFYNNITTHPLTGQILSLTPVEDDQVNKRSFVLLGLGMSYKTRKGKEIYANFSQNYRSVNFNDLRVINVNFEVAEDLKDESGFNIDLGIRGEIEQKLTFDASLFFLQYNDRIGSVLTVDEQTNIPKRRRQNVSDARIIGVETFGEVDISKILIPQSPHSLRVFTNLALIHGRYLHSDESAFDGKEVELIPPLNLKMGVSYQFKDFRASWQFTYVQEHFSDASNALETPSAIEGLIPNYSVMDLSFKYSYKHFLTEFGINNLLNQMYFTRRASGYPGPGIIPADGRNLYLTLAVKL